MFCYYILKGGINMKSFKKITASVAALIMLSTVATSVAFAELGDSDSVGESTTVGTSDVVTPGESDSQDGNEVVTPGESDSEVVTPGESDSEVVTPGESDSEVVTPGTTVTRPDAVPSGVAGDANGDGTVRVNDVQAIRTYLLHAADASTINWTESDVTNDGNIRVNDVQLIRQFILKQIDSLENVTVGSSN
jgi:hypothetical protein